MKKTFIQWFFVKTKNKNNTLTVHIFYNLQNHPTFLSDERLVNWARGRECFVGLSVLIVYGLHLIYSGVLSILVVVIDGILLRFATRPGGEFFLVCQPENAFIMWYKNKVMFWNIYFKKLAWKRHTPMHVVCCYYFPVIFSPLSQFLHGCRADFHRAFLYCDSWDISKF